MINWTLYKKELKSNLFLALIFGAIMTMYCTMIVAMFDPELSDVFRQFSDSMPGVMNLMGFGVIPDTMTNFIYALLYGFIFIVFPMIFMILVTQRLIYRYIDRGSFVYLLATPNSRFKIIFTQFLVVFTYLLILVFYSFVVITVTAALLYPGTLDILNFLYGNVSLLLMLLFIEGITFFSSSVISGKYTMGITVGLPVLFFVFKLIANLGDAYQIVKYFTPFSLFNVDLISTYDGWSFLFNGILFIGSLLMFGLSFYSFRKRDLSI
jgi:ABC-2 type transport system permease protein